MYLRVISWGCSMPTLVNFIEPYGLTVSLFTAKTDPPKNESKILKI